MIDSPNFLINNISQSNDLDKILIIDDNIPILNSMSRLINKTITKHCISIQLMTGVDGIDLLKYLIDDQSKKNLIKMVFLDEYMDYMNGSEAIRIIKNLEKQSKIKKVFICKTSSDNEVSKMLEGVDYFINKPIAEKDIEKVLKMNGLI